MKPIEFRAFYERHLSLVRRVAYQIAGRSLRGPALDDLVQEAFVKIWRGLPDFRSEAEITSWIYRVTTHAALDHLKSLKRKREDFTSEWSHLKDDRNSLDDVHAVQDLVHQALETLSEDHRTVIVLVLLHDRTLKEVADSLEIPEGTVKSRLHAAKLALTEFLKEKGVSIHD